MNEFRRKSRPAARVRAPADPFALVAPTLSRARAAAASVARHHLEGRAHPISLKRFLASPHAPASVVLCPDGKSLAADLSFLRGAGRMFWRPPSADLAAAIAGLRGDLSQEPVSVFPPGKRLRQGDLNAALLLEGVVTAARVQALLASPTRQWIVEDVRKVRLNDARLKELDREGIRWSVLQPIRLVALLATPRLARARLRWRRFLPARTRVWIRGRPYWPY